ncbi:MAG: Thiol:disulfide oxidoreductase related to ResA, partial [uncultured Pseudonocardia sp.]
EGARHPAAGRPAAAHRLHRHAGRRRHRHRVHLRRAGWADGDLLPAGRAPVGVGHRGGEPAGAGHHRRAGRSRRSGRRVQRVGLVVRAVPHGDARAAVRRRHGGRRRGARAEHPRRPRRRGRLRHQHGRALRLHLRQPGPHPGGLLRVAAQRHPDHVPARRAAPRRRRVPARGALQRVDPRRRGPGRGV